MNLRKGILLFFVQIILYCLITFNMRSVAQGNYIWTAVTDLGIAFLSFLAFSEIAGKTNKTAKCIGYSAGSVVGSLLGIGLSKIILKQ